MMTLNGDSDARDSLLSPQIKHKLIEDDIEFSMKQSTATAYDRDRRSRINFGDEANLIKSQKFIRFWQYRTTGGHIVLCLRLRSW